MYVFLSGLWNIIVQMNSIAARCANDSVKMFAFLHCAKATNAEPNYITISEIILFEIELISRANE